MNLFQRGPRLLALTAAVAVALVKGSSYEVAMIINRSGPGGYDPDHCYDVVISSEGVKVTVEELYKMEIENCMDTATGGLYSGGTPLYKYGPTKRELFEETLDHKEPVALQETQEQENQNERSLLGCVECQMAPTCNTCRVCCITCTSFVTCFLNKCAGCYQRREEEVEENNTSFEGEMRRLQLADDEANRVKMASTCTENVKERTRLLNENGNFCMGNYLDVNVVPVIYTAAK